MTRIRSSEGSLRESVPFHHTLHYLHHSDSQLVLYTNNLIFNKNTVLNRYNLYYRYSVGIKIVFIFQFQRAKFTTASDRTKPQSRNDSNLTTLLLTLTSTAVKYIQTFICINMLQLKYKLNENFSQLPIDRSLYSGRRGTVLAI